DGSQIRDHEEVRSVVRCGPEEGQVADPGPGGPGYWLEPGSCPSTAGRPVAAGSGACGRHGRGARPAPHEAAEVLLRCGDRVVEGVGGLGWQPWAVPRPGHGRLARRDGSRGCSGAWRGPLPPRGPG